jgi:hypothetical protein
VLGQHSKFGESVYIIFCEEQIWWNMVGKIVNEASHIIHNMEHTQTQLLHTYTNTSTTHAKACIVALGHERWALVGRVGGAALRSSVGVASKVLITRADVHRLAVDGVACARRTTYITC